jgi:hypothetical protein
METYRYPLDGRSGKNWHVLWKIDKVLGFSAYSASFTLKEILVGFETALSPDQEAKLAELMADESLFKAGLAGFVGDIDSNVYVVKDVFMHTKKFKAWIESIGIDDLDATVWAVESDPVNSPKVHDRMEIHFNRLLTHSERVQVESGYARLGSWKA